MSDTIKEIVDIPQNFFREGTHFVNRCTKPNRKGEQLVLLAPRVLRLTSCFLSFQSRRVEKGRAGSGAAGGPEAVEMSDGVLEY